MQEKVSSLVTSYAALRPRDGFSHPHQEHMKDTYIFMPAMLPKVFPFFVRIYIFLFIFICILLMYCMFPMPKCIYLSTKRTISTTS